jgi:hypothetical protein
MTRISTELDAEEIVLERRCMVRPCLERDRMEVDGALPSEELPGIVHAVRSTPRVDGPDIVAIRMVRSDRVEVRTGELPAQPGSVDVEDVGSSRGGSVLTLVRDPRGGWHVVQKQYYLGA